MMIFISLLISFKRDAQKLTQNNHKTYIKFAIINIHVEFLVLHKYYLD